MKLTTKQISKIRELSEEGHTQMEIAKIIGVAQKTVCYWLFNEDKRKEISHKTVEAFRKKSQKEKSKIYKSRLEYLRSYRRKRYHNDEVFREKEKKRVRDYYKLKGGRKDGRRKRRE